MKEISLAIDIKINPKKFAALHFLPKRLKKREATTTKKDDGDIQTLEGGHHYQYLGMEQEFLAKDTIAWDRVAEKCLQKSRCLWKSDLTFRQKVEVHNTTVIPSLTYVSASVIKGI